jgi:hypothetical protein
MTIHWLRDLLIVIGGVNIFVGIWALISWYFGAIEPKRTPREQFLYDKAKRSLTHKRVA